jgi:hypothetical protein
VDKEFVKKISEWCGVRCPTTGIMVILYHLLNSKNKIYYHGFNGFVNKQEYHHYYDTKETKPKISNTHDFKKEDLIIEELCRKGLLFNIEEKLKDGDR